MYRLRLGFCSDSLGLAKQANKCILDVQVKILQQTVSNVHDKIKTGKAIKQLNKENKYLFGELLDRPRSKATTAKGNKQSTIPRTFYKPRPVSLPLDGIQSEALWNKSKKELDIAVKAKSKEINDTKSRHWFSPDLSSTIRQGDEPMLGLDLDLGPDLSSELPKLRNASVDLAVDIRPRLSLEKEVCTEIELTRPSPVLEVSAPRQSLELPDIIIRNIPTFPLFNTEKTDEDQPSHSKDGPILNIATEHSENIRYPSVTKILNATMSDASRAALARWRKKMIAELGEEGFLKYSAALLAKGSEFHHTIQDHLSGVPSSELHIGADIEGSWRSVSTVIPDLSNVKVLESHVVHPKLMYHGVIDCVAEYKKKLVLIEWKKSDKLKKELAYTYDAPLQLAAYLGAINYDRNYHLQVRGGVVVVAYTDGTPAQVFRLTESDCVRHWSLWLLRLQQYWKQQDSSPVQSTTSASPC